MHWLEEKLYEHGFSQKEMSEKTGISESKISRIINGVTLKISHVDLKKISDFFDESLADIQKINLDYIKKIKNANKKD